MSRTSPTPPCNLFHRLFYWKEMSRRIEGGCQGDWLEVTFFCKRCRKTVVGESDADSYAPEVGRSDPPLTEWSVSHSTQALPKGFV